MGKHGVCAEGRDNFDLTGRERSPPKQEQCGPEKEMGLTSQDLDESDLIL